MDDAPKTESLDSEREEADSLGKSRSESSLLWPRVWLFLIAMFMFALDQITKAWVVASLGPLEGTKEFRIFGEFADGGWLRFVYSTNTGAAFGIFKDATIVFIIIAIIALPALLYLRRYFPARSWLITICFGLLVGGNLGNLLDRLRLGGRVTDFIDAGWGSFHWATFNIADASFVTGVILLAGYILFFAPKEETTEEQQDGKPDDGSSDAIGS